MVFVYFLVLSALQLRGQIAKKTFPERSQIQQKIDQHLDSFFDRFLNQLGSILGGFWPPSWSQVGTKSHQNQMSKLIKKRIVFWKVSGSIFGRFWGPCWRGWGGFSAVFLWFSWLLVGSPGQDGSKTSPRRRRDRF